MKWIVLGLAGLMLSHFPASAETLNPFVIEDSKNNQRVFFPFYYWHMEYQGETEGRYRPFLMERNGTDLEMKGYKEKPSVDLERGFLDCYIPSSDYRGGGLNRSLESNSPDGKKSISFYWNMTFANDENNIQLILKNVEKRSGKRITVPVSSMGIVYPMFWNGSGDHFYFLVEDGKTIDRSYGLWQFGVKNESFHFVGETNGRFFLSPDGAWIVWETGRLAERPRLDHADFSVQLILYNILENKCYQLTHGKSVNLFDHWKN